MNLHERNRDIVSRLRAGEKVKDLAVAYNLSDASIRLINKQIVKKQNQTPHWSDSLTVNARSLLLKWAKRKGYRREQLSKDYVRQYILNGTFRYPGLGPMLMTELAELLEIEYTPREV